MNEFVKDFIIEDSEKYDGLNIKDKTRKVVAEMGETGMIIKVAWMMEIEKALYSLAVECARAAKRPEVNSDERQLTDRPLRDLPASGLRE